MTVVTRVAALVVAVALVAGAFVLREGSDGPDGAAAPSASGPVAARCPTELRDLCRDAAAAAQVGWRDAGAASLAEDLVAGDGAPVLLPTAWADVADAARARAGQPPLARSDVLATSPLLLVAFEERAEVLARACGTEPVAVGWACIGEHAGRAWTNLDGDVAWGDVRAGHLPPDTASGLVATAGVVAARTGPGFSLRDLQDVGFTTWFRTLQRAVQPLPSGRRSYLEAMRVTGPPAANIASVLEAELATSGLSAGPRTLVVSIPEPLHAVELVVVATDGDAVADLHGTIDRDALRRAGWRVDGAAPQGAPLPDLPPVTEAPDGGVLTAVRTAYAEVS